MVACFILCLLFHVIIYLTKSSDSITDTSYNNNFSCPFILTDSKEDTIIDFKCLLDCIF